MSNLALFCYLQSKTNIYLSLEVGADGRLNLLCDTRKRLSYFCTSHSQNNFELYMWCNRALRVYWTSRSNLWSYNYLSSERVSMLLRIGYHIRSSIPRFQFSEPVSDFPLECHNSPIILSISIANNPILSYVSASPHLKTSCSKSVENSWINSLFVKKFSISKYSTQDAYVLDNKQKGVVWNLTYVTITLNRPLPKYV